MSIGTDNDALQNATINYNYVPKADIIYGDVTGDGNVNAFDRVAILRYIAKWSGYETLPYVK